jgi:hypothetical protein
MPMSVRTGDAKDGVPGFIGSGSTPVVVGDILKPVRRAPEQSGSEGTSRVTGEPSGIRPGERGSLGRVGGVLFEPVSNAARGYLTRWLGRAEGVTFTSAHVGTGERRTEGLVRSDTGGLPIQGGSGAFSPSSPP